MIPRYTMPDIAEVWSDKTKFSLMLEVELLTAEAQAKLLKLFPEEVVYEMRRRARFDLNRIHELEKLSNHDIVAFIQNLSESLGDYAAYLHKGLTSNDLIDTSFAVQIKKATEILLRDLDKLIEVVKQKALAYKRLICIGRTHGVHAEPIVFGMKFALFYDELKRAKRRILLAMEEVAVGKLSGAVGNFAYNPPEIEQYVCEKLGIKPASITTQVVPRDRHAWYILSLSVLGCSIERFVIEIRHLQRTEVLEVEEPFRKGQKGSSAMPHKRNPILSERLTGQARLLRSYSVAAMENVALWHERDISHSSVERVIFPDATILLDYMLNKLAELVRHLNIYPERMKLNLELTQGLIYSQALLSSLMDKGVPRMKAYEYVQRSAMRAWEESVDFLELVKLDKDISRYLSEQELRQIFSPERFLQHIDKIYQRLGLGG